MSGFFLRVIARVIALLPFAALPAVGRVVAFLAFDVLRIRRAHVQSALARAGLPPVAREVYQNLGASALELLWLSARSSADVSTLVTIDGHARFREASSRGRGVIVATAHTGNWDLTACACASVTPLTVVTKRLSSRSVDRLWQETRAARGVDLIAAPEGSVFRRARERLSLGRSVAVLIDQDPERTHSVVDAPFLGELALHDTFAATLAARTGAPIVVAFARRDPHVVEVINVIIPPPRASRAWIERTTREIAAHLDSFVRRAPASWLWLHRRWKTQLGQGAHLPRSHLLPGGQSPFELHSVTCTVADTDTPMPVGPLAGGGGAAPAVAGLTQNAPIASP